MDVLAVALVALVAVFTVLTVLLLAGVARRLLGLRFSATRTLLAGAIAFGVSGPLFQVMAGKLPAEGSGLTPFWFLVLAVACALLVAMVFLVLAEVLVPTGSVPPAYEWGRVLRGRLSRTRRYWQIVRIALRHGLGPGLRGRWRAAGRAARAGPGSAVHFGRRWTRAG